MVQKREEKPSNIELINPMIRELNAANSPFIVRNVNENHMQNATAYAMQHPKEAREYLGKIPSPDPRYASAQQILAGLDKLDGMEQRLEQFKAQMINVVESGNDPKWKKTTEILKKLHPEDKADIDKRIKNYNNAPLESIAKMVQKSPEEWIPFLRAMVTAGPALDPAKDMAAPAAQVLQYMVDNNMLDEKTKNAVTNDLKVFEANMKTTRFLRREDTV